MRRIHYSAEPLTALRSVTQDGEYQRPNRKPAGLWYSIGRDWERWCRMEEFGLDRLTHRTLLDVDTSRVLHIGTEAALRDFAEQYGCEFLPGLDGSIDWPAVAGRYTGIEIHPYQWGCRLAHRALSSASPRSTGAEAPLQLVICPPLT